MAGISPISPMGAAPLTDTPNVQSQKSNMADYNTFIKLLVAQMKNQDPTNPSDPTKYVSQLASFSAVEQATQTNSKLAEMLAAQHISQAGSYIGKQFEAKTEAGVVKGVITSVQIFSDGLVATLDGDPKKTAIIGPGAIISDVPKQTLS